MKTDHLQSYGHCWVFQICWHMECSTLTASSFRIWNSLAKIPSPPLALFVVMLPKARLTLHSMMSGSRRVVSSPWLSGSLRSFFYSSVYSCHLFLLFMSFIVPIFAWNIPLISLNYLKPSLSFPFYFPLFLCIVHWGSLSFLSLLFFGALHSYMLTFPFLMAFIFSSFLSYL